MYLLLVVSSLRFLTEIILRTFGAVMGHDFERRVLLQSTFILSQLLFDGRHSGCLHWFLVATIRQVLLDLIRRAESVVCAWTKDRILCIYSIMWSILLCYFWLKFGWTPTEAHYHELYRGICGVVLCFLGLCIKLDHVLLWGFELLSRIWEVEFCANCTVNRRLTSPEPKPETFGVAGSYHVISNDPLLPKRGAGALKNTKWNIITYARKATHRNSGHLDIIADTKVTENSSWLGHAECAIKEDSG